MKSRKIPTSHGSHITGIYASIKAPGNGAPYESTLERDCIALLDKNPSVTKIETQSIRIIYYDRLGKRHIYTPDILVHYSNRAPRLLEVKPRNILREKISEYHDRYVAATKYARKNGWAFRIVTEYYIRGECSIVADKATNNDDAASKAENINIAIGECIEHNRQKYTIAKILGLEKILARVSDGGAMEVLNIAELQPSSNDSVKNNTATTALENIPHEQWQEAEKKYQVIKNLVDCPRRTTDMVRAAAQTGGVSMVTIYSWIKAYEQTGQIVSLLPKDRRDKGANRLSDEAEAVISSVLETEYLHKQRRSIKTTMRMIEKHLVSAGIEVPHINTIRNRIKQISPKKTTARRVGHEYARRLKMSPGRFPDANKSLDVVQMDHSQLDIILVDSIKREPLGRPWLTLVIDVFSRAALGFHVALDAPGTASAGACVANAILPKENLLRRYPKVTNTWPCWGAMRKLHMDNAGEFRGNTLRQACLNRGIGLEWRPVRRPEYGGHIERMMGTIMKEIHELPGSTYSSPQARTGAKSEKNAALTLAELEEWLAIFVVDIYNRRLHGEIKQSPLSLYEKGLLGAGRGLPKRETDERRLRIDFLPIINRKVQRRGIVIDGIYYYHPVLEKYFLAARSTILQLRRDPHDLSHIFLYDKDIGHYISVGYANIRRPVINIWELRAAQKFIKQRLGATMINEDEIFNAYDRMRAIENAGKKETKSVRRERERKITGRAKYKNLTPSPVDLSKSTNNDSSTADQGATIADILPFDEVEKLI